MRRQHGQLTSCAKVDADTAGCSNAREHYPRQILSSAELSMYKRGYVTQNPSSIAAICEACLIPLIRRDSALYVRQEAAQLFSAPLSALPEQRPQVQRVLQSLYDSRIVEDPYLVPCVGGDSALYA